MHEYSCKVILTGSARREAVRCKALAPPGQPFYLKGKQYRRWPFIALPGGSRRAIAALQLLTRILPLPAGCASPGAPTVGALARLGGSESVNITLLEYTWIRAQLVAFQYFQYSASLIFQT